MDSKLLIVISISAIAIIGIVSILMLEVNMKNSLGVDEVNSSNQPYFGGNSFSGGNMKFYEKWCVENNGIWNKMDNRCGFETEKDHMLARTALDKLEHPEISGNDAQRICQFLDISCPAHVVFPGYYDATEEKTFVSYEYKGSKYRFDVTEPEIKYMLDDDPQWFDLGSELKSDDSCLDNFDIRVSTTKKFYFPGDEIVVSGSIHCTFDENLAVPNNIPITLQIISNDDLIEVAQIEIIPDGKFSHLVNAMGPRWQQSGEYTVKAFYGKGYGAETNFEFFADADPKPKN